MADQTKALDLVFTAQDRVSNVVKAMESNTRKFFSTMTGGGPGGVEGGVKFLETIYRLKLAAHVVETAFDAARGAMQFFKGDYVGLAKTIEEIPVFGKIAKSAADAIDYLRGEQTLEEIDNKFKAVNDLNERVIKAGKSLDDLRAKDQEKIQGVRTESRFKAAEAEAPDAYAKQRLEEEARFQQQIQKIRDDNKPEALTGKESPQERGIIGQKNAERVKERQAEIEEAAKQSAARMDEIDRARNLHAKEIFAEQVKERQKAIDEEADVVQRGEDEIARIKTETAIDNLRRQHKDAEADKLQVNADFDEKERELKRRIDKADPYSRSQSVLEDQMAALEEQRKAKLGSIKPSKEERRDSGESQLASLQDSKYLTGVQQNNKGAQTMDLILVEAKKTNAILQQQNQHIQAGTQGEASRYNLGREAVVNV